MVCKFCNDIIADCEESVKLTKKGKDGICRVSLNISSGDNLFVREGDTVHTTCRQKYLKRKSSKLSDDVVLYQDKDDHKILSTFVQIAL